MIDVLLGAMASVALVQPLPSERPKQVFFLPEAKTISKPVGPRKRRPESFGVKTSAASVFVADVATGSVLYAKDPHRVMPIASITKLMTAMVFLDQKPDMKKTVTIQAGDFDGEGKAYFKTGDVFTNEELLKTMLSGSVNASAHAIARSSVGKEAFVKAMNEKAQSLGLKTPHFVEASGVDPENKASAADVAAILSNAAKYPFVREFAEMPVVEVTSRSTGEKYKIDSTNLLLSTYLNKSPYKIVAAKTGSLPEAGFCMTQITRNAAGNEIVAVELGSDNHFSRYQDIKALTTWAFDTYTWD
jgi:serine-type D-Ala-D-Ala endopeptidase (penicillin-binding protein 7)